MKKYKELLRRMVKDEVTDHDIDVFIDGLLMHLANVILRGGGNNEEND